MTLINRQKIIITIAGLLLANHINADIQHSTINGIKQNMHYSEVRSILIENGWQAAYNHLYHTEYISERDIQMLTVNEWHEVDSCAGTGAGLCSFDFFDVYDNHLKVTTIGDCYNAKGLPALIDEKCDLKVIRWSLKNNKSR